MFIRSIVNELRWFLRHSWHSTPWTWIPDGDDARCDQCGYIVKGGGREARNGELLRDHHSTSDYS